VRHERPHRKAPPCLPRRARNCRTRRARRSPIETRLEREEREHALHAAIQALPRAQREAVVLHYFGDLTCPETAAAMGISPGAVMTHLFRARKSLRAALSSLADEEVSR
jgi:RNA polymerase sigma-70 factor (ECF subfamily)